ncbi:MAG: UvrD-helicase domain-containing protein, partial [Clostridia bacterium]|nr:UvrD-helicase domain-containing protein [Clostridia bacterium]
MSNYTPEQLKAITQKKGNLVVTASAGSGKTRVMTQRFIDLTVSGATEVDRVLCVTFTRLAAEELKSRLKRSLMNAMLASVGEKAQRLKRQLEKLPSAAVSTVHSFCNFLIQKYFYVAEVDPQFTVIDEKTSDGFKKSAVDELFESLYESGDKDFLILLETFISSRSDRALKEIVIRFYDFISSEVDGQAYLSRSVYAYGEQGVKNAVNGLIGIYIDKLCLLKDAAFKLIAASKDLGLDRYVAVLEPICEYIDKLDKTRSLSDLIAFSMGDFTKPRVTVKGDEDKKTVSDAVGDVLSHIKTIAEKCREYLNFADFNENARKAGKVLAALKSVVERFSSVYARLKSDIAALDYSDLEHYAYKVLCSDEVLNEVKSDYDYVFVDEYQDTNAIQEAIFSKIENDNLFVVGDEKQSIYGFRGCDSTIFAERIRAAQEDQLVSLDKNFRSAKSVVRAVNKVFTASMTPHCSGIDYAAHPMVYGGLYDGSDGVAALVVSGSGGAKKSDLVKGVYSVEKHLELLKRAEPQKEQVAVRKIVESVVGQRYFVTGADGKKEQKTIGFGDIAVLTRTSKAAVDKTVAELTAAGIPVSSDSKRSIGDYPEIKLIVDLLKAVYYGGKEDFSLAAALHSPVGGLDDESLMLIRKTFEGGTYYSAVRRYAEERIDGISIKLNDFFAYIGRLKTFAAFEPVVDIVKRLVKDSRLDAYFLTESFGALKEKRLERFIVEMESSDATLDDFVKNHEAILENMTVCLTGGDDSVKVMDIHQSMGLEFPVVILTEQGRNFFGMGRRDKFTRSRKYGVGLKRYDAEKRTA